MEAEQQYNFNKKPNNKSLTFFKEILINLKLFISTKKVSKIFAQLPFESKVRGNKDFESKD